MLRPMMASLTPANARRLVALSRCEALQVTLTDDIREMAKEDLIDPSRLPATLRDPQSVSVIQKLVDANMRAVLLVDDDALSYVLKSHRHRAIKLAMTAAFYLRIRTITGYLSKIENEMFWREMVSDLGEHDPIDFRVIRRPDDIFDTSTIYDVTDDERRGLLISDFPNASYTDFSPFDFMKTVVIAPEAYMMQAARHIHRSWPDECNPTSMFQYQKTRHRFFMDRNIWDAMNVISDLVPVT